MGCEGSSARKKVTLSSNPIPKVSIPTPILTPKTNTINTRNIKLHASCKSISYLTKALDIYTDHEIIASLDLFVEDNKG